MDSKIIMAGIDQHKADITVREKLSFTKKQASEAMQELIRQENIVGCVLLSTCNRTELWLSLRGETEASAGELLCSLRGVEEAEYAPFLEQRDGREAVEHLFYLAAGLKSQIMGEDQILTQVGDALTLARDVYCTDQVLEILFRSAVTAGKKVKTNVPMPHGNASAADAAIAALQQDGFTLEGKRALVIGNGMMGRLTAEQLMKKGASVTVTIRQYRSGIVDTPPGVRRIDYDKRYEEIPACDVIFSATASPNLTITRERLAALPVTGRKAFVDLAVPRDMEPAIDALPYVKRYDMDMLLPQEVSKEQKQAFLQAEDILQAAVSDYAKWYEAKDVVPQILALSEAAAQDVTMRLEKPLKRAGEADNEELQEAISRASGKVVEKLLFGIRDSVDHQTLRDCLTAIKALYEE